MADNFELNVVEAGDLSIDELRFLERARNVEPGGISSEHLGALLGEKRAQLWRLTAEEANGIFVTQVQQKPDGKDLLVWLASGEGLGLYLPETFERFTQFGQTVGCKRLMVYGIPAVARTLTRQLGFATITHQLMKEI